MNAFIIICAMLTAVGLGASLATGDVLWAALNAGCLVGIVAILVGSSYGS